MVNKATLKKGARVEQREHKVPWPMAQKIARDHLKEDPRYYSKLAKMEDPRYYFARRKVTRKVKRW